MVKNFRATRGNGGCFAGIQHWPHHPPVAAYGPVESGNLDTLEDIYDFFCEPRCGQPLVNTFCVCGIERDAELVIQACSFNAQGQRCTLRQEIEPLTTALTAAEKVCLPYSHGSSCSQACKTALVASRDLGGCCVNLFNITRSNLIAIDDYALWASCGIQTPGFCGGSSLSPSGNCNKSGGGTSPSPSENNSGGNSPSPSEITMGGTAPHHQKITMGGTAPRYQKTTMEVDLQLEPPVLY